MSRSLFIVNAGNHVLFQKNCFAHLPTACWANFVDSCMRGTVRNRREMHVILIIVNRWPFSRSYEVSVVKHTHEGENSPPILSSNVPYQFCQILNRLKPSLKFCRPCLYCLYSGVPFCSLRKEEKRFQKQDCLLNPLWSFSLIFKP